MQPRPAQPESKPPSAARRAARLREALRPDLGDAREGRRREGARGALRAPRAARREARAAPAARPRGRARRGAGLAREARRPRAPVPRRVAVLDLAAPARRQHVQGLRPGASTRAAPSRSSRTSAPARDGDPVAALQPRPRRAASSAAASPSCRRRRRRWSRSRTRSTSASRRSPPRPGLPVGTAKCYAHRGRERLRERLSA